MNNPLINSVRTLLRAGLFAALSAAVLSAQDPVKADGKQKEESPDPTTATPTKLEAFQVTGSHLKRIDYEGPSPVVTYTAATIEDKGYTTLGDFVQSLPFNNGTANTEATTNGFVTSAVTANPRGLGSNRFLTLINGRRAVPFAFANSVNGTAQSNFNFNSIPLGAIERTEWLKDGASAIYGSDAITGVMNIILKKDYNGSAVDFTISNTLKHDSLSRRVNAVTGLARNGWDIFIGVNHQLRHSTFLPDYGIKSIDYRYLGAKGAYLGSTINNPSYLRLSAAQATSFGIGTAAGYYVVANGVPTANPTKSSFTYAGTSTALAVYPYASLYDQATDTQIYPANESTGGYANIGRRLTATISAYAQFRVNRTTTYYDRVPPGFSTSLDGFTYAADNPYNPFGVALTTTAANIVFTERDTSSRPKRTVYDAATTMVAGLRGTALGKWEWDTAVSFGTDHATDTWGLLRAADLQAAFSGTTRATAFNIFGPSDNPGILSDRTVSSLQQDNKFESFEYTLSAAAKVWQIPLRSAGEVGMATGYEFRQDTTHSRADQAAYVGFSGNAPYHGQRKAHSTFVEFSVPLQKWLELNLAARHERFSDFGETTKPKYSALLKLPPGKFLSIALRGSYSESFKAPDLGQLYAKQTSAITSASYRDPLRPQDGARQIRSILGGNPALQPEEGKVQYFGVVLEFPGIKGLSLTADYLDIKIGNVIQNLSPDFLFSVEGIRQFPNAVVRDNSVENPGPVSFIYGVSVNQASQVSQGWDFGLKYSLRQTRFGTFNFNADATQIVKRGSDSGQGNGFFNSAGRYFAPVWRSNLSVNWSYKKFGAAVVGDIVGKYFNNNYTAAGWGENIYAIITPSFTYRGFKKSSLTFQVNNVFDHRPGPTGYTVRGFNDRVGSSLGAFGMSFTVRGKREF